MFRLTTVVKVDTVDKLAIDSAGKTVDLSRCRHALSIEQGHTRAEHALYTALWKLGGPPDDPDAYRDVSIGYDKLVAVVGGSKKSISRLAEILRRKLAIEIVWEENSAERRGKTYRVYGPNEILRRRREAGYVWTVRNRSAVALVRMTAAPAAVASSSTDTNDQLPPSVETTNEVGLSSPLGETQGENRTLWDTETAEKLMSTFQPVGSAVRVVKVSAEPIANLSAATAEKPPAVPPENHNVAPPASALEGIKEMMDDDKATHKLLDQCRSVDQTASDEEILHFLKVRVTELRRRAIFGVPDDEWREKLIASVPRHFGNRIQIERHRLAHPR